MVTTIGIDPHKATHTAVAIDGSEIVLDEITIRADKNQTSKLIDWATSVDGDGRVWAVEAATGLGHLLSQQLIARGETVVDVPPVLASRIRVLSSGKSQKNDPNDARSVAIAALRRDGLAEVRREDDAAILRMLAKRHRELTALRTQAVCRLHAMLAVLRPGGMGHRSRRNKHPACWEGSAASTRSVSSDTAWRRNTSSTSGVSTGTSKQTRRRSGEPSPPRTRR